MFVAEPLPNVKTKLEKQNQSRILAEKICDVENFSTKIFSANAIHLPNRERCQVPRL